MDVGAVLSQVQHVAGVRADGATEREHVEAALRGVGRLEAWLAGTKAALVSKLATQVSFPEKTLADCTRSTTRDAINDKARADTLGEAPLLARALDDARVTSGHVDEVTRATRSLDDE